MRRVWSFTRTLVGQKIIMAVSGAILLGFLLGHMLGNLKVFQGPEHFNAYADGLRSVGAPFFGRGQALWLARGILIAALALHIWAAILVTRASWRARPVAYRQLELVHTTYAARTMRWGGVIIVLYVVYHLLDFTFGRVNPGFEPANVYRNVLASFTVVPVAAAYIVANVVVGLHVYHGLWSAFQTLGLNWPPVERWRRTVAAGFAVLLTAGYVIVPVAVLTGGLR
jgi:succinate dehydrogenase / fumarate reductase cytochrome b subunit